MHILFDLFVSSDIWQADPVSRVSGPDPDEKPDPDRKSGTEVSRDILEDDS